MAAERDSMTLNKISYSALGAGHARSTPDPEVVAKPKRRQFTAQYRLRILRRGRSLHTARRGGPPASPRGVVQLASVDLAQGPAQGLAAGVGREEARRETGRTQFAGCEGACARGASGAPGARVAHRAHDPGRVGKSCRAAGIEPRTRNALLMVAQPLAEQVGAGVLGVSRATFYRRQRSTPRHQQPRPTPARALSESEHEQVLDVLADARFVDHAPAEVVATLLDEGHYLCSERTMYRILAADRPVRERRNQREHPQVHQTRAGGHGAEPDLVLGHHQAVGADEVDVLLPLRRARHLQPLRGRLDGGRPGELGAGRSSHRRDLPQTRRPAPSPHPALRPWGADDEQVHRTTARRPRGHALAKPPPGVR